MLRKKLYKSKIMVLIITLLTFVGCINEKNEVLPLELVELELTSTPNKTTYFIGEDFDSTGLVLTGIYNNGSKRVLNANEFVYSDYDNSTSGEKTIVITSSNKKISFKITYEEIVLEQLNIISEPNNKVFKVGYSLDSTGLVVEGIYNNGTRKGLEINDENLSYNNQVAGIALVTINVDNITTTFNVKFSLPIRSITIEEEPRKIFQVGTEFNTDGLVVSAIFADDSSRILEADEYTVTGGDISEYSPSLKTITIASKLNSWIKATYYIRVTNDYVEGDYQYIVTENNEVRINKYHGNPVTTTIPASINNIPVTEIGSNAYSEISNLESIIIPSNITDIGQYFLYSNEKLTNIIFEDANNIGSFHGFASFFNINSNATIKFEVPVSTTHLINEYLTEVNNTTDIINNITSTYSFTIINE